MSKFGTSQSVLRKEDLRFLTGTGTYLDDARPQGAAHAVFLRSPVAHGRITALDTSDAADAPGVLAIYVAADLAGKLENSMNFELVRNRDGSKGAAPRRPMLADDRVCHLGESVAIVVAETLLEAQDALELIAARHRRPARPPRHRRGRPSRSTPRRPATSATTGPSATRPRSPAPSRAPPTPPGSS